MTEYIIVFVVGIILGVFLEGSARRQFEKKNGDK